MGPGFPPVPVEGGLCESCQVTSSSTSTARAAWLVRDPDERLLAGVATAVGRRLGVDVMFVRTGFAVLALAGGVGVLLYLVLWATTPEVPGGDRRPGPAATPQRAGAFAMQVAGAMLVLRGLGLWLGDPVVWPLTLAALGSSVLWARSDDAERARWLSLTTRDRPIQALLSREVSLPRRVLGAVLVLTGIVALLVANVGIGDIGGAVVAFVVAVLGVVLLLGPAVARLLQQIAAERRERIRTEERADITAHLHDSVLHTLALIQRSDSPQEMATLARSQERELRAWLQGRTTTGQAQTVAAALEDVAARIEAAEHVAVDLVVVGDASMAPDAEALVGAIGEAATNAARHAAVIEVSVYVEIEPATITAYVRDEGKGFDPATVPPDRHGIAQSIRGRVERQGGTVVIDTAPGEGTEVSLTVPRRMS
ncbi:MAG: PspC domain-containing protein [Nitriliruptorales bacterium]|nr:PspC domain-containing protein [Nitriliruptorales bacterium]